VPGDVVTYLGSSYSCIISNSNITPIDNQTTFWLLLAKKGDTGDAGNIATRTSLGIVKTGDPAITNVNINAAGTISVTKGAGINKVTDISNVNSTSGNAVLNDGALLVYNRTSERWDTVNNLRSDTMDGGFF
jgi:hypothetical protein